jgi:hypothetical protein
VLKIKSLSSGLSFLSCLLLSFLSQERKERSKKRYPPTGSGIKENPHAGKRNKKESHSGKRKKRESQK